jgi:hypothetical protein
MFVSDSMENMNGQLKFELEPVYAKSDFPEKFFSSDKAFNNGI